MEISKPETKHNLIFKRKKNLKSKSDPNYLNDSFLPLPWKLWPYEGQILIILIVIWCTFGLLILGSASWWVASKEMGDWAFYLKRQLIWCIPGLSIFYFILTIKYIRVHSFIGPIYDQRSI